MLFKTFRFTRSITRNGRSLKIPVKNGVGVMNLISQYEPWFRPLLKDLLKQDDHVVIDIGANTGQTLLKILPEFSISRYIAVEPNPNCVSYLNDLCSINNFGSVEVSAVALADCTGHTELLTRFDDDLLATTSSGFRKFTNYAKSVRVPVCTGDELMQSLAIDRIDLIKVDVEGSEAAVLAGLKDTLRKFRPIVICEILPLSSKSEEVLKYRTDNAGQLIRQMRESAYTITNIVSGELINRVGQISGSLEEANYLLKPEEKK